MQTYKITVMKKLFIFFALCILHQFPACADQCALIPKDIADNAYNILKNAESYIDFCAPCMDKEPITKHINNVEIQVVYYNPTDENLYQILIDDSPIDIAYVYVNGKNLGMQVNCTPIIDVPEYIDDYVSGRWHFEGNDI